ncbi:N-acetyltransferase [Sphingomonas psychrotolerans]|uniref:N-acetyltransferase n=1 Tax=Sphingomonas psychrotolerans TaxID=1327635 RepID=A0ABU3MZV3_9SPHN|nr:N-acetyltransferase [Sphingomonas psychrotolerans]MDT8757511.1 N-acetyltransferase [Sphingomonas psychrotolerans]
MIALVPLSVVDPEAVEALLDRAFGPERRTRTAYRIRGGALPIPELSFAALDEDESLLGTIQCWPVELACDRGETVPLVMVGPVAVEPGHQQGGIGRALMARMLDAVPDCTAPGCAALMLIGDPEYYGRFFSFTADRTGGWRLPGPFEPRRLLARGEAVPDCAGMLGPRVRQPA